MKEPTIKNYIYQEGTKNHEVPKSKYIQINTGN